MTWCKRIKAKTYYMGLIVRSCARGEKESFIFCRCIQKPTIYLTNTLAIPVYC